MSTSLKESLPINSASDAIPTTCGDATGVYNLMVFVRQWKDGGTSARAANLPLEEVRTETVREALSGLVAEARRMISDCVARGVEVPWVAPPLEAEECESRFMVPLHL